MHDKKGDILIMLFVILILVFWALLIQTQTAESRDPQPGLQVQLIEIEGMTCVAVYTLDNPVGREHAPIDGISCNWDEYD